eukprot:TRINITY_DN50197_c0_g1_i1.p1 TRINITY_DN50197_c0_g1~~TRINITY_DN50197_c0_g1_i1.p1  ORF type:complete len:530 (+),score=65.98 TRINITY_DN50197_c0_g1_i1:140-1729(+)
MALARGVDERRAAEDASVNDGVHRTLERDSDVAHTIRQIPAWMPPGFSRGNGGRGLASGAAAIAASAAGGRYAHRRVSTPESLKCCTRSVSLSEDPKMREMNGHVSRGTRTEWHGASSPTSLRMTAATLGGTGRPTLTSIPGSASPCVSPAKLTRQGTSFDAMRTATSTMRGLNRNSTEPTIGGATPAGTSRSVFGSGLANNSVSGVVDRFGVGLGKTKGETNIDHVMAHLQEGGVTRSVFTPATGVSGVGLQNGIAEANALAKQLRQEGVAKVDKSLKSMVQQDTSCFTNQRPAYIQSIESSTADVTLPTHSQSPMSRHRARRAATEAADRENEHRRKLKKLFDPADSEHSRPRFREENDRTLRLLLLDVQFAKGPGIEDADAHKLSCNVVDGIYDIYHRNSRMEDGIVNVRPPPPNPAHIRFENVGDLPKPGSLRGSLAPDAPPDPRKTRREAARRALGRAVQSHTIQALRSALELADAANLPRPDPQITAAQGMLAEEERKLKRDRQITSSLSAPLLAAAAGAMQG